MINNNKIYNNNILKRMNMDSLTILSKNKPRAVRIIHIFASEIINIDPANFRELVQRLTGKPSIVRERSKKNKKKFITMNDDDSTKRSGQCNNVERVVVIKREEDVEIWRPTSCSSSGGSGDNESSGFLTEFADMDDDGFIQQLGYFQTSMDHQNHPLLMHHHNPYYTTTHQQHSQKQQQHHFFGEEDHADTDHNRVI